LQTGYGRFAPAVTCRTEDKIKAGAMSEFAMIFFEYIVFLFKIFTILLAAIVVTFIDFRRFKARYGKRTFFSVLLSLWSL
jgi:hypothetical protein